MGLFSRFRGGPSQRFYNSIDINRAPVTFDRAHLGMYHHLLPQEDWETDDEYYKRLVDKFGTRFSNLNRTNVTYNPNPTQKFFPQASSIGNQRSFVSLDIETDDYGHPISISALKFQYDKAQGKFVSTDNYQRFYKTHGWNIRSTQAVHGFTPSALNSLRKQQGATYGKTYRGSEIDDLKNFLGKSVIVGHNIQQFDLNKLFPDEIIKNSTIDTLAAARNAWEGKKNDLDHVFHRLFGKTMEQAGLSHHDANADTIASMMILEKMAQDPGTVGQSIRYVMGARGQRQLVEYDKILDSMVVKGTYKSAYGSGKRNLNEVYMTAEELGLKKKGEYIGGFHEDIPMNPDQMTDEQLMKSALVDAAQYLKRKGGGIGGMSEDLFEAVNQFNNYKRLSLVKQIARARSEEEEDALLGAAGYRTKGDAYTTIRDMGRKLREVRDKEEKISYLDRAERKGSITAGQRAALDNLTGSYEDLVDATNDVIEANERLAKVYQSIADIKPYDINNLIGAAHSQWSGIKGAAHGVVPSFVRVPLSRLGDAAFNAIDRSVSPWNAVQRIYNNTAGKVLKGIYGTSSVGGVASATGHTGWGIGIGTFNAGTQIVGNVAQAGIEMKGLSIQNTLNTLGAMISWVATPFQLLHKAAKLLIGSFTGLSYKLNSFMGSGIGMMSQMGNPLTALTGMDYSAYIRSTLKDSASLLRKGTMNSTIENFAQQQQMFYTMGQVDTNRLIAASLLGVYSDVYNPTNDTEGAYNSMANKLLNDLKTRPGSRSKIMALAGSIDSNLPQLLASAELMGISDVSVLDNPNRAIHRANGRVQGGVFYNPLTQRESSNFRWTQWEYGAAREQMGFSKMRIADKIWTAGGKSIYNAANRLFDGVAKAIDTGDWSHVVEEATYIWNKARDAFSNAWEGIKSAISSYGSENGEGNDIVNTFKGIGALLENIVIKGALKILNVWDNLMVQLADRLQGAITYLSTVQVKPYIEDGKLKFNISTIKDRMEYNDSDKLYSENSALGGVGAMVLDEPNEGMKGIIALGEAMGIKGRGGSALNPAYNPTIGEIKDKLRSLREQGYQYIPYEYLKASGTPIEQIGLDDESIDAFIRNLKGNEGAGTSWEKAAVAFATPSREGMVYNKKAAYDKTGIGGFARQWVGDVEDVVGTLASAAIGDNYARVDLWFKSDTGKKAMIGADSKGSVFSKDIVLLQQMVPEGMKLVVDQIK